MGTSQSHEKASTCWLFVLFFPISFLRFCPVAVKYNKGKFSHRVCPKHRIFGRQESRRHTLFNIERYVPPALRTYVPRNSQETVLFYQGEGLPLNENDERRCWSRTTRWIEIPICSERESTFHKSFAVNCFNSCLSNDFELRSFCAVQMSLVRIRGIGIT